ncbi:hypothetical protein [Corynebacterium riegelii]|uniref:hypothetical protein n=1 Tax=Corynebacterium riegelii TaxID=156976 RepID=UPI000C786CB9|nr:hypothetical protein [Corynebacterium riegelii]PLA11010.1 hypothetical protein CYJ48_11115 [Corynebacterium riegelii]
MTNDFKRRMHNGIPDPEENLVRKLAEEDKGRFRRTAKVVYRCRKCGKLLGFAYPVRMLHPQEPVQFGELDDDGHLLVNAPVLETNEQGRIYPQRPEPWGPLTFLGNLEPGYMFETWWFFAYRHVDPEFMFLGDGPDDVGFSPAGGIKGLQVGREAPEDVRASSSPGYIGVGGERDVWAVTAKDWWRQSVKRPPVLHLDNPPGLLVCKDSEAELSLEEVENDMEQYLPHSPVRLPKHN